MDNKTIYEVMLEEEIKKIKNQLEEARQFIEKECVYDERKENYVFGLSETKVKKLNLILKGSSKNEKIN